MFDNWLPYTLFKAQNPVFDYDLRRMTWPRSSDDLRSFTRNIILGGLALFGLFWLALFIERPRNGPWVMSNIILLLIGISTVGFTIASDFYCAVVTVGVINQQLTSGNWDLLRLTRQRERSIFTAKLAVAQIRTWRVMSVEMALRAVGIEFAVLTMINTLPRGSAGLFATSIAGSLLVISAVYIVEPRWKMSVVVGIGAAIAAQVHSVVFAMLGTLGAVLAIRMLQAAAIGAIWFLFLRLVSGGGRATTFAGFFCGLPLMGLGIDLFLWRFYKVLDRQIFRRAYRAIFQAEVPTG